MPHPARLLACSLVLHGVLGASLATAQPFSYTFVETNLPTVGYGAVGCGDVDGDGDFDLVGGGDGDPAPPFAPLSFVALSLGERLAADRPVRVHTFEVDPLPTPFWHNRLAWSDVDLDGDLDAVMAGTTRERPPFDAVTRLYRGDGQGGFREEDVGLPGLYGAALAWGDYDNDGDRDLLMAGSTPSGTYLTSLYRNDDGALSLAQTPFPGLAYGDAAWVDIDLDADLDLVLTGATDEGTFATLLYHNEGGAFTLGEQLPGLAFSAVDAGDLDGDAYPELVLSGGRLGPQLFEGTTHLYVNVGGALRASDQTFTGAVAGHVRLGDYDNDGDRDLLIVGGRSVAGFYAGRLYRNEDARFTHVANLPGLLFASACWGDQDDDGDLDLFLSGLDNYEHTLTSFYRNDQTLVNTPPEAPTGLVSSLDGGAVALTWTASRDDQTPSASLTYALRVGTAPGASDVVAPAADPETGRRRLPASGPASGLAWRLAELPAGTYYWSVQAVDASFVGSPFAEEASFTVAPTGDGTLTGADDEAALPKTVALHAPTPNPFRASARLTYDLPEPGAVRLTVYNALGAEVVTLFDGARPAGRHEARWDGHGAHGARLAAGLYLALLRTPTSARTQRLLLLH